VLWGGRLKPGESVRIPDAQFVHLFVAKGSIHLEGSGSLNKGDAVRLIGSGALRLTAEASTGAEILIWEMAGQLKLKE
jgi:redox-sensitive bicupin YhaK (pirin superfamily)